MSQIACHRLLRSTAQDLAHECYQSWAQANNLWFADNRDERKWVLRSWPRFIEAARVTLAQLLAQPISEHLKESIHDALVKDNTLRRGRSLQIALEDMETRF